MRHPFDLHHIEDRLAHLLMAEAVRNDPHGAPCNSSPVGATTDADGVGSSPRVTPTDEVELLERSTRCPGGGAP